MNSLALIFGICMLCGAWAAPTNDAPTTPAPFSTATSTSECDLVAWSNFKNEHKKGYENSEEDGRRRAVFCNNLSEIQKHNAAYERGEVTYKKGINKFSDLTHEEWMRTYLAAPKKIYN